MKIFNKIFEWQWKYIECPKLRKKLSPLNRLTKIIDFSDIALKKLEQFEADGFGQAPVCMANAVSVILQVVPLGVLEPLVGLGNEID